jgi:hypothetical protein
VHRHLLAVTAALAIVLAGCGGPATIEDPNEILERGFESLLDLDSFSMAAELTGTLSMEPGSPGFNVAGTSLELAVDLANERAAGTFTVPPLFGMTGEFRMVDGFTYFRSSMTGPMWSRSALADMDAEEAEDPSAAIGELRAFLVDEDVEVRKLDDAECGEDICYHLQLAIPTGLLDEAAADEFGGSASDVLGAALIVDLLFDKEHGYLRVASTSIESPEMGSLTFRLTLDAFNEPVDVEAPPEDEIDESGGDFFPFP